MIVKFCIGDRVAKRPSLFSRLFRRSEPIRLGKVINRYGYNEIYIVRWEDGMIEDHLHRNDLNKAVDA
jgi:hypothetical protein